MRRSLPTCWTNIWMIHPMRYAHMRAHAGIVPDAPNNCPVAKDGFMGSQALRRWLETSPCGQWAGKNCAPVMIGFIVGVHQIDMRVEAYDFSVDHRRQPAKTILARRAEQVVAAMAAARRWAGGRKARCDIAGDKVAGGFGHRHRQRRRNVAPTLRPRLPRVRGRH